MRSSRSLIDACAIRRPSTASKIRPKRPSGGRYAPSKVSRVVWTVSMRRRRVPWKFGEQPGAGVPLDQHRVVAAAGLRLVGMQGKDELDRLVGLPRQRTHEIPQGNADLDLPFGVLEVRLGVVVGDRERAPDDAFDFDAGDDGHGKVLVSKTDLFLLHSALESANLSLRLALSC